MNDYVWFSDVMNDPRRLRPLTHSFATTDAGLHFAIASGEQNNAGESLGLDRFPSAIFPSADAKSQYTRLPDIIFAGSFYVISEGCAEVIRQFDLGGGHLYPVEVLQKDKITPIGGHKWFCINFGNAKKGLIADQSRNIELRAQGRYINRAALAHDDIAVSKHALSGPDLWVEVQMWNALFLSGRLGDALKKAKCASGWGLIKCRVVDEGGSQ